MADIRSDVTSMVMGGLAAVGITVSVIFPALGWVGDIGFFLLGWLGCRLARIYVEKAD